jgi:uncharacterized membrane protein
MKAADYVFLGGSIFLLLCGIGMAWTQRDWLFIGFASGGIVLAIVMGFLKRWSEKRRERDMLVSDKMMRDWLQQVSEPEHQRRYREEYYAQPLRPRRLE